MKQYLQTTENNQSNPYPTNRAKQQIRMTAEKKSAYVRLIPHQKIPALKQRFSHDVQIPQFSAQLQERRSCDTSVYNYDSQNEHDNLRTARNTHRNKPFVGIETISPIKSYRQLMPYYGNLDGYHAGSSQMLDNHDGEHNCSDGRGESEQQLREMILEMNSLKEAINRANYIADFLAEENYLLNHKCIEANNELEKLKQFYQQKLHTADSLIEQLQQKCSLYEARLSKQTPILSSTTATAYHSNNSQAPATPSSTAVHNIVIPKPGSRVTPLKVYNKNNQIVNISHHDSGIMQDLAKVIWKDRISEFWSDVHVLEQITDREHVELQKAIEQHKYLQAYVQDQILFNNKHNASSTELLSYQNIEEPVAQPNIDSEAGYSENVSHLLKSYQTQILLWQNYATTLKRQLTESISFIQKMFTAQPKHPNKRSYTSKDLIKYISKQIRALVMQKLSKNKNQITELRELLDEVFKEMKKKGKTSIKQERNQSSDRCQKYCADGQKKEKGIEIQKNLKRSQEKKALLDKQDDILDKYFSN